ncbi:hypothetical protein H4R26_002158 [Coemansia thaxteri]|uniref:MICOS complex subunit n=1 Tax=Coemansia thaxteri TaxID=2663907 RepID=A0A9W8EG86_9FUNG|nr:hypothetical protein H4R26_002158 [Coemansia thaxteri]
MDKKSIYDEHQREYPSSTALLAEPPTRLVSALRSAREEAISLIHVARTHGQLAVQQWIGVERAAAALVQRTVPEGERLAPGIIYVGVAALAGPIFTRRRNFALRWLSPLLFASATAAYALPGTSTVVLRNVWGRYGDPAAIDWAVEQYRGARVATQDARTRLVNAVQELRLSLQQGRRYGEREEARVAVQDSPPRIAHAVAVEEKTAPAAATAAAKEERSTDAQATKAAERPVATAPENSKLPLGFKRKVD